MALPSGGTITMDMIRTELKKTGAISLGSTECRQLAGKPSGAIKMSDFYGKSSRPEFDITVNMFIKLDDCMNDPDFPGADVGILRGSPKPTEKIMGGTIDEFCYSAYDEYMADFYLTLINCTEFFPDEVMGIRLYGVRCHYPDGTNDEIRFEDQDKDSKEVRFYGDMSISYCNLYKYAKNNKIDMNGRYVQIRIETFYE